MVSNVDNNFSSCQVRMNCEVLISILESQILALEKTIG